MASLVVQSRFAGLVIEDDDESPERNTGTKNKVLASSVKKVEPAKKFVKTSNIKSQSAQKKKKSKLNRAPSKQWEQWKQKDEQILYGKYEDDLQQAIMLSKLDYEEKKDVYKRLEKQSEIEKNIEEQLAKKNKKKKKFVMSLEQFNDMLNGDESKKPDDEKNSNDESKTPEIDTEFFDRLEDQIKNELLKDKLNERLKTRLAAADEVITKVKFLDAIEKKDKEIAALREEVNALKTELFTVKCRNKKLCNILAKGEMRDKAQILIEVEKLKSVQAELTAELAALHTELEKERSKNTEHRVNKEKRNSTKKKSISEANPTKESASIPG